ncbi:MAG: alpha/beta hydrolase [Bacteroidota bacterium]
MIYSILLPYFLQLLFCTSDIRPPAQPDSGPGGGAYQHSDFRVTDASQEADGYWLYEPDAPRPDSAHVIVFTHGYGALNPMIYGGWIRHLVRKGNIVIFPRYQKNLLAPPPEEFPANVATAIRNALLRLDSADHVRPITRDFSLVGHSYGGVISANLGVHYASLGIPQPKAMLLCSPGSGPFKGAVLNRYDSLPPDLKILIMVSERDHVVGDKFGKLVFNTAPQVKMRNLLRQYPDSHGSPSIDAGHNESYFLDEEFDSGLRNMTTRRAMRIGSKNAVDYFGYWKLFDALLSCQRSGEDCNIAFGNSPEQRFMGEWSDGKAVRELEVSVPQE